MVGKHIQICFHVHGSGETQFYIGTFVDSFGEESISEESFSVDSFSVD